MNPIIFQDITYISQNINYAIFNNCTILITGATGFIAKYLVHVFLYLNDTFDDFNCKLIVSCRSEKKAKETFYYYLEREDFKIIIQDIVAPINHILNVDFIFHAASPASTGEHRKFPVETLTSNLLGTNNLLELAKINKNFKKFIYFSSGAVYGKTDRIVHNILETDYSYLDPLDTAQCYAEGKRAGEALCAAYYKEYGISSCIVRISHTYGPGIDLNDGHVYSDFVKSILNNSDLIITGDGQQYRPFTYIADCITAIFKIVERGCPAEAYNMANNGAYYSIAQLATILANQIFPEKELKVIIQKPSVDKNVPYSVDTTRLQSLGWHPQYDIIRGFRRTVESFQS